MKSSGCYLPGRGSYKESFDCYHKIPVAYHKLQPAICDLLREFVKLYLTFHYSCFAFLITNRYVRYNSVHIRYNCRYGPLHVLNFAYSYPETCYNDR